MKHLLVVLVLGCLVVGYSESVVKPDEFLVLGSTDDLTIGLMDWTVKHEDKIIVNMDPNGLVNFLDPNHVSDEVVDSLVKSGRVCKVIGHRWKSTTNYYQLSDLYQTVPCDNIIYDDRSASLGVTTEGYYITGSSSPETRTCDLCNLTQTKVERWE